MTEETSSGQIIDWRDADAYRPLLALGRAGWAWEALRRNPDYARLAAAEFPCAVSQIVQRTPLIVVIDAAEPLGAPRAWGLHFLRNARLPGRCRGCLLALRCRRNRSPYRGLLCLVPQGRRLRPRAPRLCRKGPAERRRQLSTSCSATASIVSSF